MLKTAFIRAAYMAVMFLAGIVLSNLALPERFGTISLLILNASLLSIITGFGSDSMAMHMVAQQKWSVSKAYQFTWRTVAFQVGLFVILEAFSFFIWKRTLLSFEGAEYLLIDAAYFVGLTVGEKFLALLYAFYKSALANIVVAAVASVYCILLLSLYYFVEAEFTTVLYLFALQSLLQGLALVVLFKMVHKSSDTELLKHREFFSALKFSSIIVVTNIVQLLAYRVDFWLLQHYYSNYEVGLFAQANKFANLIWILPNIIAQLLIPQFSLLNKNEVTKTFGFGILTNVLLVVVSILLANLFYFYYLDVQYRMGLSAFYIMLPGYFFWAGVIYFGAYISWAGKFHYNFAGSVSCLIIIVVADFLLIPVFGIEGAAWANTITYSLVFIIYFLMLTTKFGFNSSDFWRWKDGDFAKLIKFIRS